MGGFFEKLIELFTTPEYIDSLLHGFLLTIEISFFAVLIGFLIGLLIALVQTGRSKWLKPFQFVAQIYVTTIRGTPMALQLFIMFFVIFAIRDFPQIVTAILAFAFNSGAYTSEIIRGGILSVDSGQTEAGLSLGLTSLMTMYMIVLPQAVKNILPALCNEGIAVLKESSIVGLIAVVDLTRASDLVRSRTLSPYFPLISVAIVYYFLVAGLSALVSRLEKRLRHNER